MTGRTARGRRASVPPLLVPVFALALLAPLALPHRVLAQVFPARTYTEADGLPNNQVRDVVSQPDGTLRVLTRGGLASWDGSEWRNDRFGDAAGSLAWLALSVESPGSLWILAKAPEPWLARLSDGHWSFFEFPPELRVDRIGAPTSILAKGGTVYVGSTMGGVVAWREGRIHAPGPPADVRALAEAGGRIWAATAAGLSEVRPPDGTLAPVASVGLPKGGLRGVAAPLPTDEGSGLWIAGDDWVGRFLPASGEVRVLARRLPFLFHAGAPKLSMAADPTGGVYAGAETGFVHVASDGAVSLLGVRSGLASDGALALRVDREGTLWIASARGLTKLSGRSLASWSHDQGLLQDEVTAVRVLSSGTLVAAHNNGVSTLGPHGIRTVTLPRGRAPLDPRTRVMDIASGPDGTLWLAGVDGGLCRISPEGEETIYRQRDESIWSVVRLPDGSLLAGTIQGLLALEGGEFRRVPLLEGRELLVRRISVLPDGSLLVATANAGLVAGRPGAWRSWRSGVGPEGDSAYDALSSSTGRTWVGTLGGLLEVRDGRLVRPPEPELAALSRPVFFVREDRKGRLWIGTDFGVFVRDGERLRHLSVREGLAGNETNRGAFAEDEEGRIYVGTDRGLTRWDERLEPAAASAPVVRIEAVERSETAREGLSSLLRGGLTTVMIQVRAVSLLDEKRIGYRTRLEGFDAGWREEIGGTRHAERYTNLPPGTYRYAVRARAGDGPWSAVVSSAEIRVDEPFWRRAWFAALLVAAVAGATFWGARVRVRMQVTRRLESEVRERTAELLAAERRAAEEAERLAVILSGIADGVLAIDLSGCVLFVNGAAAAMTGVPEREAPGQPVALLVARGPVVGDVGEWVGRLLATTAAAPVLRLGDGPRPGSGRRFELSGACFRGPSVGTAGAVLVLRDVTAAERAVDEAARAQRLEAIGLLAGGIAHDFNNVLAAILGNVSLARHRLNAGSPEDGSLETAERAVRRGRGLAGQLLAFARGGTPVRVAVDLAPLLRDAARISLSGSGVAVRFSLPEALPSVNGDAGQLTQVFTNLFLNARDAMGGSGDLDIFGFPEGGGAAPARVAVSVRDHGPGIPPESAARLFDPYFTTKADGSGLGLAVCYSIVTSHGGTISASSPPDGGALFTVVLPCAAGPAAPPQEVPGVRRGKGRVLAMDDEEAIRTQLLEMLRVLGYEAEVASRGEEALEAWERAREAGRPFDLVLLDLTIRGGMGGQRTLAELRRRDRSVRVVGSTGYSAEPVDLDPGSGFDGFLPKPYGLSDLGAELARVLAKGGEPR